MSTSIPARARSLIAGLIACALFLGQLVLGQAGYADTVLDEPPGEDKFEQITLALGPDQVGEALALAVLPDGRVLHTSRDGRVFLSEEGVGTAGAARIPVYKHDEEGLQGIAVPPDFAQSRWVYLMYAPQLDTPADDPTTPGVNEGDAPAEGSAEDFERYKGETYVSRFRLEGDTLDRGSEQVVLKIPADRGLCCHVGGDLNFDRAGNLLISTGDDTNPFSSDGYTPIDERPNRNPSYDAQRTSSNTNDLRGKILRIRPTADGGYTIPEGNLFGPNGKYPNADSAKVRPEIYAMGFRNPFRFSIDAKTGWLYVGEYGPDAASESDTRGPGGLVEVNQIREPGNYGWPYCSGPNLNFNDYDFATGQSGPKFNCDAPVNESPNNTGLRELPPAKHPWIWYDGGTVHYDGKSTDEFGNGGEAPMGGPVYRFDSELVSDTKFPSYFDGHFFMGDWSRGWMKEIEIGAEGQPTRIHPFFDSGTMAAPMDFEFGPDGSLYVVDYGSASYGGMYAGGSPDAAIYKINYVDGSRAPIARVSADRTSGTAPLTVSFSSAGSRDPEGDPLTYAWDFDGDGSTDATEANPAHTYNSNGTFTARLTVTDSAGKTGTATETIIVGNDRPTVTIKRPADGGVYDYGDRLSFEVKVTDPQDGPIDCNRVRVETALGHNEHAHGDQSFTGCSGTVTIPAAWEPDTQSSFYVVSASYTDDGGADGTPSLTGSDAAVLQPRIKQAEHFSHQSGVKVVEASDPKGGGIRAIGELEDGDHVSYKPVDLTGIDRLDLRIAAGSLGGKAEVRADAPDGPLLGSAQVPGNLGAQSWTTVEIPVRDPGGPHEVFLVFRNPLVPPTPVDADSMMVVNYIEFVGTGLNSPPTAQASATPTSGAAPLTVEFTGRGSDPEDDALSYHWDFGVPGEGADTATARYTYTEPGSYTAVLTVTDAKGNAERDIVKISVTEGPDTTPPVISDVTPAGGSETSDRQPAIGATVQDDRSDLTTAHLTMYLDGQAVEFTYDKDTHRITHMPAKKLATGTHQVRVIAEDPSRNTSTRTWSFTVVR
ncbi:PKD domain-containing protein [Streptomyces himalayensis]|uniref:PQQ-dependent sugar dehydrogenase n=1 Tax=Streptomyces himalayensis subsp. himalayensis TaxID=2756131 RepID=A0A7W0I860_9ACTN|nr:PKD domain-containing protein [Streptomyces himalayensis]MBA2945649.1 PQQ-dependent sugar dehydrogenase [Streptomyces himalayensis subsp. himalayensis]